MIFLSSNIEEKMCDWIQKWIYDNYADTNKELYKMHLLTKINAETSDWNPIVMCTCEVLYLNYDNSHQMNCRLSVWSRDRYTERENSRNKSNSYRYGHLKRMKVSVYTGLFRWK